MADHWRWTCWPAITPAGAPQHSDGAVCAAWHFASNLRIFPSLCRASSSSVGRMVHCVLVHPVHNRTRWVGSAVGNIWLCTDAANVWELGCPLCVPGTSPSCRGTAQRTSTPGGTCVSWRRRPRGHCAKEHGILAGPCWFGVSIRCGGCPHCTGGLASRSAPSICVDRLPVGADRSVAWHCTPARCDALGCASSGHRTRPCCRCSILGRTAASRRPAGVPGMGSGRIIWER